ncbi:DUF111 domain containing protein [Nitzschia inconspicua]|uniref:DUF111 domain containing protein n=1 Tax=Nitzschia inconspicua TaxID=303405 RepID=A0A9K3LHV7_9STRA|nr:DUF111 domain containing protein [Nitzschia inconspicua]
MTTATTSTTTSFGWTRPSTAYHAHFDCFSGAAGDMLLAACLDAYERPQDLLDYIVDCLVKGIPELDGEFTVEIRRVQRGGMGSIAGLHVKVNSKYQHAPAPVPQQQQQQQQQQQRQSDRIQGETYKTVVDVMDQEQGDQASINNTNIRTSTEGSSQSHDHNHHHHEHEHDHGHTHSHHDHSHDHSHGILYNNHTTNTIHSAVHPTTTTGPLRTLPQIRTLLEDAPDKYIPPWVKSMAIATFTELARAEAATHGVTTGVDSVHFHEVGAIDSIVDTVGTLLALYCWNVQSVSCSRLPIGEGMVWTAHGWLPVPAPATLRLLVDMPTCPGPLGVVTGELVTPTGVALLRTLRTRNVSSPTRNNSDDASSPKKGTRMLEHAAGRPPNFTIRKIGIGAGTKDFDQHPNILRLILGDNVTSK